MPPVAKAFESDVPMPGAAVSLSVALCAVVFFILAGGRGSLGPIDYGGIQLITVGIWTAAPAVGGLVTHRAPHETAMRAAATAGAAVAAFIAFLLFFGPRADQACTGEAVGAGPLFIVSVGAAAASVGVGFGAGLFATSRLTTRVGWLGAILAGCVIHFGGSALGYWITYNVMFCAP
jgi:hypothetical protein